MLEKNDGNYRATAYALKITENKLWKRLDATAKILVSLH